MHGDLGAFTADWSNINMIIFIASCSENLFLEEEFFFIVGRFSETGKTHEFTMFAEIGTSAKLQTVRA